MSDLAPPSLDDLPTQPPPPAPSRQRKSGSTPESLASRDYKTVRRLWPLTFVLLVMQSCLVCTAWVVAVWRPSLLASFAVIGVGNVVWTWGFVTMASMLGRAR